MLVVVMINQINFEGKNKVEIAIERLRQFEPKEKPYYVAISGGKDSDVIVKLCELAKVKHELYHQHTTADAPQTVRYIKAIYPKCNIDYPDKSIWKLIEEQGIPPTRLMRYCCKVLKEYGGEGRTKVLGVRWSESTGRKNNRRLTEICYKNYTVTVNPIIDLTEQECWRLQGYSDEDYYNALSVHPGTKGKLNGALYKQAGNSIPIPILESIFKQLLNL